MRILVFVETSELSTYHCLYHVSPPEGKSSAVAAAFDSVT